MKTLLHICLIIIFFISTSYCQTFSWAKQAGGISIDYSESISTDANGNSYITGRFRETATFGTLQLVCSGDDDIFVAKYNANGNCVWAKKAGGTSNDCGTGISTDANGNFYMTGYFTGTATFDTIQLVSQGNFDIFVAKYNANGNCVWAKQAGGDSSDLPNDITMDANGNIFVTGRFWQTASFDTVQLVSSGGADNFIAKYDVNGNCVWAKKAGGISNDWAHSISTDANGNSYVTGTFKGIANFGSIQLISYGVDDIFVAKYNANGNCVWAKKAGGTVTDFAYGISTDANGNSYVTGGFQSTATFDTIQLVCGSVDIFIAKYNANGNCVWAKKAGGTSYDYGQGISTYANGNSYMTGYFTGTATFDTIQLVSQGNYDIFVAKYNANGNCVWAKQAGGTSVDYGIGISTDANGNSYVTGTIQGTANFGSIQLISYGAYDIFIAKINNETTTSVTINSGWNILSVPLAANDMTGTSLFPTVVGNFYSYNGGYNQVTNLGNGRGYWAKFDSTQHVTITGTYIITNEIPVVQGWNLIGPFEIDVPVSGITSVPPDIIMTPFYGYEGGYTTPSVLLPGKGYWIKVSQGGNIYFNVDKNQ